MSQEVVVATLGPSCNSQFVLGRCRLLSPSAPRRPALQPSINSLPKPPLPRRTLHVRLALLCEDVDLYEQWVRGRRRLAEIDALPEPAEPEGTPV